MIVLQSKIHHQQGQEIKIRIPEEISSGEYELVMVLTAKSPTAQLEPIEPLPIETGISAPKIPAEDHIFLQQEMKALGQEGIDPFAELQL